MNLQSISSSPLPQMKAVTPPSAKGDDKEVRQAFDSFVGEVFFGQMLSAMRESVGKPAYFHGGRAEEIFQGQLDQVLSEEMTAASADTFTGPMFELFQMTRQ
jgi:flagellar protein FlgJ